MTVRAEKPSVNLREKLAELDKPTGIAGEAMLRAETPQEQFNLIGAGRRNLIINGGMNVSQRGDYSSATATTNNAYYLDRWRISRVGVSGTMTHTDNWQRLDATSSATGTYRVRQPFELQDISRLAGKTVTLSARVKSNSSNARLLISADGWLSGHGNSVHSGSGQEEYLTLTVTLPDSISSSSSADVGFDGPLSVDTSIQSGDYIEFTDVQLEVGKVATPFEHRSYGEELALCQRYYYSPYVTEGDDTAIMQATTKDSSTIIGVIHFPVAMRTGPSIVNSSAQFRIDSSSKLVSNTAGSTVVIEASSPTTGILKIQGWTGLSTDNNFACKYLDGVFGFQSEL